MQHQEFEEFVSIVLDRYNNVFPETTPVDKHDTFFKSYLIGVLSVLVDKKTIDTYVNQKEKTNG